MFDRPFATSLLLSLGFFLVPYLVGSIPTAYIVVRKNAHIDIRSAGTGNVGTLNAYEVTRSRWVGLSVLLGDVFKGALSVFVAERIPGSNGFLVAVAAFGVVVGHCFPVWLRFKGGRGLAPAAGAMLVVAWIFVAAWLLVWLIGYLTTRNIHLGNTAAIVATPLIGWMTPASIMAEFTGATLSTMTLLILYTLLSAVLLFRHLGPLRELAAAEIKKGS